MGTSKGGGEPFAPPSNIEQPVAHVAARIHENDRLRSVSESDLPREVAYLYDYVNYAHPFREGNGRAQREFFDQLLAESHHGLDWQMVDKNELYDACHRARNTSDLDPMKALFERILNKNPAYPASP